MGWQQSESRSSSRKCSANRGLVVSPITPSFWRWVRNYSRIRPTTSSPAVLSSAPRLVDAGRAAERLANRLVEPAKILVIVGIAYTLATAGWYLVSGPAPATLTDNKAAAGRAAAKPSLSVADIIARNLFGKANVEGNAPAVYNAPETHLRLTLEGVFQAEVPEESAAIIAEQGQAGRTVPRRREDAGQRDADRGARRSDRNASRQRVRNAALQRRAVDAHRKFSRRTALLPEMQWRAAKTS